MGFTLPTPRSGLFPSMLELLRPSEMAEVLFDFCLLDVDHNLLAVPATADPAPADPILPCPRGKLPPDCPL